MASKDSVGWDLLIHIMAERPTSAQTGDNVSFLANPKIPFVHFASSLPEYSTPSQLHKIYKDLYTAAERSVENYLHTHSSVNLELHATDDGSLPISYNLAMTTTDMAILPRRSEGSMLLRDDGSEVGFVALNGTALAGTLMVKYQEEWEMLKARPEKLDQILETVGLGPLPNS